MKFRLVESVVELTEIEEQIIDKMYQLSETELIHYFGDNDEAGDAVWILPNGTTIEMDIHQTFGEVVFYNLSKEFLKGNDKYSEDDLCLEDAGEFNDHLVDDLNWVKYNTGNGFYDDRCYVCLPTKMTSNQYRTLEYMLEESESDGLLIIPSANGGSNFYGFDAYSPNDIIKRIKKYYISGILEESVLNESKADEQRLIDFAGEGLARRFLSLRQRFKSPENDLYYWIKNKTPQDLERAIYEIENSQSKSKLDKEAKSGAKLVCDTEHWKIYSITTFEASQYYGRDTKWCITGVNNYGDKYWNDYTNRGIKFYFLITKGEYDPRGDDSKFAIAVYPNENGFCEVYNQQDKRCFLFNVPHYEEINIPGVELDDFNEDTAMCYNCECLIDLSGFDYGGLSPEGEPLCNDCFDELCDFCYFCDSPIYREEATYLEDIEHYVCEYCLDRKCGFCEECGEYFTLDSLIDKNNRTLCVNCSSEVSECLHTKMKFKLLEDYSSKNALLNEDLHKFKIKYKEANDIEAYNTSVETLELKGSYEDQKAEASEKLGIPIENIASIERVDSDEASLSDMEIIANMLNTKISKDGKVRVPNITVEKSSTGEFIIHSFNKSNGNTLLIHKPNLKEVKKYINRRVSKHPDRS